MGLWDLPFDWDIWARKLFPIQNITCMFHDMWTFQCGKAVSLCKNQLLVAIFFFKILNRREKYKEDLPDLVGFFQFQPPSTVCTVRDPTSIRTCAPCLFAAAVDGVQLALLRSGCGSGGSTWIRQARMNKVHEFIQGGPLPVLTGLITPMVLWEGLQLITYNPSHWLMYKATYMGYIPIHDW